MTIRPPTDAYGNPVDYDDSANNYNSAEKKRQDRKQEKKTKDDTGSTKPVE